jgi:hypothetical protein
LQQQLTNTQAPPSSTGYCATVRVVQAKHDREVKRLRGTASATLQHTVCCDTLIRQGAAASDHAWWLDPLLHYVVVAVVTHTCTRVICTAELKAVA